MMGISKNGALLLLAVVLSVGALATETANAGTITVTYDLTGSVFNATSPLAITNAALVTGDAVVQFTTNSSGAIVNGTITLESLATVTNLGSGGLSTLGLSGTINANLGAPVSGTLTGNVVPAGGTANVIASGVVNCSATGACAALLGLPPSTTVNQTVPTTLGALTFANLANPISSSFTGSQPFAMTIGALASSGTINLVGHAIATAVPEPGTALMLAAGLVGLALSGRSRKRS